MPIVMLVISLRVQFFFLFIYNSITILLQGNDGVFFGVHFLSLQWVYV